MACVKWMRWQMKSIKNEKLRKMKEIRKHVWNNVLCKMTKKKKILMDHKLNILSKNNVEMKLVVGISKFQKSFVVNYRHLLLFKKVTSKQYMPLWKKVGVTNVNVCLFFIYFLLYVHQLTYVLIYLNITGVFSGSECLVEVENALGRRVMYGMKLYQVA